MNRSFILLATAAMLSLASMGPVQAMEQEHSQLVQAVERGLNRLDMDTSNIDKLTLGEVSEISQLLRGESMSEATQKNALRKILSRAESR